MKALALALSLALAPGLAEAGCTVPANQAQLVASAAAAVNSARKANGQRALTNSSKLDEAALAQACWIAETGKFSHKGQGGSLPKARIKATGYRTRLTAENIAWGQESGAQVVAEWMESSGHRANILRRGIDQYGLGVALLQGRPVWVMTYAAQ